MGLTDSNGTLVSTYQYDPYGNLLSSTGSVANPWRFAGGYFDSSTGLYKFGTRYYNPGFGRWSQQDPVRGHLKDPTSLNRYLYAGDDPVNMTDPSGRDFQDCLNAIAEALLVDLGLGLGVIAALILSNPVGLVAGILIIAGLIALEYANYLHFLLEHEAYCTPQYDITIYELSGVLYGDVLQYIQNQFGW